MNDVIILHSERTAVRGTLGTPKGLWDGNPREPKGQEGGDETPFYDLSPDGTPLFVEWIVTRPMSVVFRPASLVFVFRLPIFLGWGGAG
jgi:hypothetical protein